MTPRVWLWPLYPQGKVMHTVEMEGMMSSLCGHLLHGVIRGDWRAYGYGGAAAVTCRGCQRRLARARETP